MVNIQNISKEAHIPLFADSFQGITPPKAQKIDLNKVSYPPTLQHYINYETFSTVISDGMAASKSTLFSSSLELVFSTC